VGSVLPHQQQQAQLMCSSSPCAVVATAAATALIGSLMSVWLCTAVRAAFQHVSQESPSLPRLLLSSESVAVVYATAAASTVPSCFVNGDHSGGSWQSGGCCDIAVFRCLCAAAAAVVVSLQIHGGAGVSQDTVLAHLWAAARTLRIADGPDEVHLGTLAKLELEAAAGGPAALKHHMAAGTRAKL